MGILYRLEIENFFSVRNLQVLDLTIAPNVPDLDERFAPLFPGSSLRAPKVVAVYGANASGKTTVLRALQFLINFAKDSVKNTGSSFACERFNDIESMERPIRLAIELGGVMDLDPARLAAFHSENDVEWGLYRYELEIDVKEGVAYRVLSEALRQKPHGKGKWQRVFERDVNGEVKGSDSFPISGFRHLINTLRPNASVISSFALFQHPTASLIAHELENVFGNLAWEGANPNDQTVVNFLANSPDLVEELNRDLRRIDLGVESMRIESGPNGPFPMFKHEGLAIEMPWILESHGTRAFIRLFPLLALTLSRGGIAIIDEFDLMIHPLVLPEILRWFYDEESRNKEHAQIWLSCHSASLLDDLVKEEVVFADKDYEGRTSIYSMMDIKAVRRDDNIYRKYLGGAYGAVPQIG